MMKRLFVLMLCAIILVSVASCAPNGQDQQATTKEEAADVSCAFVSDAVRRMWEQDLYDLLISQNFYEEREYGCFGTALMDLNFDCTPELVVAYRPTIKSQ